MLLNPKFRHWTKVLLYVMVDFQQTKLNLKWCAQELNELQKANNWKFLDFWICFEPLLHGELIFMSVSSVRLLWLAAHLLGFTPSRGLFSPLLGCHQHNTLPRHTHTHTYIHTHIYKYSRTVTHIRHTYATSTLPPTQHTATTHTHTHIHTHTHKHIKVTHSHTHTYVCHTYTYTDI